MCGLGGLAGRRAEPSRRWRRDSQRRWVGVVWASGLSGSVDSREEASGWWHDDRDGLINRHDVIVSKIVMRCQGV